MNGARNIMGDEGEADSAGVAVISSASARRPSESMEGAWLDSVEGSLR